MIHYAVISGAMILRTGQCPDSMLYLQARDGETAIETDGTIGDDTHYFMDGEFREYPPRPSDRHEFDFASGAWIDPRDAEQVEADAAADLAAAKSAAVAAVNGAAGLARLRFVTDAPGQSMTYAAKQAEALAWIAAAQPADLTDYPWLAAEVGITAPTAAALASLWLTMAAQWAAAGSQIEAVRMTAISAIGAATTEAETLAAVAAARADLALITA